MSKIDIATPRNIALGTDDKSIRKLYPEPKGEMQFVPFAPLLTPMGPYTRNLVTGGELMAMYGDESLDPTSKYSTHMSVFTSKVLAASAGAVVVQRLRPKVNTGQADERDANIAGITYYLAKKKNLVTTKPYLRDDTTYKVKRDILGTPELDTAADDIQVNEVTLIAKYNSDYSELTKIDLTVPNDKDLELTPIFTVPAEAHGEAYNNFGINIYPLIGDALNTEWKDKLGVLGYTFKLFSKLTGKILNVRTVLSDEGVKFTFKDRVSDPLTNKSISLEDLVPNLYGNTDDPNLEVKPYTLGELKIHDRAAFEGLLKDLLTQEITIDTDAINPFADYDDNDPAKIAETADKFKNLVNFVTLKTTTEVEYEAIRPLDTTDADIATALKDNGFTTVVNKENVPTYLMGGEDGDLGNNAAYEDLVVTEVARYADKDDIVIPTALNKETILIDSGFQFVNKLKLAKFISVRRDTQFIGSTYEWSEDNKIKTIAEDLATAVSLRNTLALYPESSTFGTPTARAAIIMGSGKLADGSSRYRYPLTLDYAVKLAKFAGALNGVWNGVYEFSTQPNNIVKELKDIEPKYIPDSVKDKLWSAGLIWVDNEDRKTFYYGGQQTIYPNDTSILNTVPTMVVIGTIVRVNDAAHRKFSGANNMSNIDLKIAVEKFIAIKVRDKFNSQYVIRPEVYITEADELRGYSWHLVVRVYGDDMKTVMESHIEALRMSDLEK